MAAFAPKRVLEILADPSTPDRREVSRSRGRRPVNRRRFYGPPAGTDAATVVVVDYDEAILWAMFETDRLP